MAAPVTTASGKRLPPVPPLTGLRAQYANQLWRLQQLGVEIYDTWDAMSGPAARPAGGYTVQINNRVVADAGEAHVLQNGPEAIMLFSMFSKRFLEYASIQASGELGNIHLWEKYRVPWTDSWDKANASWPEGARLPVGARCVRGLVAADAFTAYFLGLSKDSVPVRRDSYRAFYDSETGILAGVELAVDTDRQTDTEYTEMQELMMEVVANAVTARESAWQEVDKGMAELRGNSVAVFAEMLADDMAAATGGSGVTTEARRRVRELICDAMTRERSTVQPAAEIVEID
jgi:hypothetical protein